MHHHSTWWNQQARTSVPRTIVPRSNVRTKLQRFVRSFAKIQTSRNSWTGMLTKFLKKRPTFQLLTQITLLFTHFYLLLTSEIFYYLLVYFTLLISEIKFYLLLVLTRFRPDSELLILSILLKMSALTLLSVSLMHTLHTIKYKKSMVNQLLTAAPHTIEDLTGGPSTTIGLERRCVSVFYSQQVWNAYSFIQADKCVSKQFACWIRAAGY